MTAACRTEFALDHFAAHTRIHDYEYAARYVFRLSQVHISCRRYRHSHSSRVTQFTPRLARCCFGCGRGSLLCRLVPLLLVWRAPRNVLLCRQRRRRPGTFKMRGRSLHQFLHNVRVRAPPPGLLSDNFRYLTVHVGCANRVPCKHQSLSAARLSALAFTALGQRGFGALGVQSLASHPGPGS